MPGIDNPSGATSALDAGALVIARKASGLYLFTDLDETDQEVIDRLNGGLKAQLGSSLIADTNTPTVYPALGHKCWTVPGVGGEYVAVASTIYNADADYLEIAAKAYIPETPPASNGTCLGGFTQSSRAMLRVLDDWTLEFRVLDAAAAVMGDFTVQLDENLVLQRWFWVKARITRSTGAIQYWISYESDVDQEDAVTWIDLGSGGSAGAGNDFRTPTVDRVIGKQSTSTANGAVSVACIRFLVGDAVDIEDTFNLADTDQDSVAWPTNTTLESTDDTGAKAFLQKADQAVTQFDGDDDYVELPIEQLPVLTANTGKFTVLVLLHQHGTPNSFGYMWGADNGSIGVALRFNSAASNPQILVRGSTSTFTHTDATATIAAQSIEAVAAVFDEGTAAAYVHGDGLATPTSYTAIGEVALPAGHRLSARTDSVTRTVDAEYYAVVLFNDALTEGELDNVSTFLKALI